MGKTISQVESEFLDAFSANMTNPINMDKLGIGYKTFKEGNQMLLPDGGLAVYDPTKPYGIVWNDIEDTYFRVGHSIPIVQQQFRRCVTVGNPQFGGSVYKYLDQDDSTKFEDGSDAMAYVSRASGSHNVMVEVPKFYINNYKEGSNNFFWMSIKPFEKGVTHTAFQMSGWTDSGDGTDEAHEASHTYISAFEATLYSDADSSVIQGTGNTGAVIADDKFVSTAGYKPWTDEDLPDCRTLIENGGGKQFDWHRYSVIRQCFLIEYMTHDSQTAIPGYTQNTSSPSFDNDILYTGITLSLGNNSGSISGSDIHDNNGGDGGFGGVVANSYRGIENFYGHLWQWVDAINFSDRRPYICGIDETFASDSFADPYTRATQDGVEITQPTSNGYQSKIFSNFLVETIGSNSASKITDYYYQNSGNRVLLSGGGLANSSGAGGSCLNAGNDSSSVNWSIAGRL